MLQKLLVSIVPLLFLFQACGPAKAHRDDDVQLALTEPSQILGTWLECETQSSAVSNGYLYTFNADGSLTFRSLVFKTTDCKGNGSEQFTRTGRFVAGSNNALHMALTDGLVDRTYSVQGDRLTIVNPADPVIDVRYLVRVQ